MDLDLFSELVPRLYVAHVRKAAANVSNRSCSRERLGNQASLVAPDCDVDPDIYSELVPKLYWQTSPKRQQM